MSAVMPNKYVGAVMDENLDDATAEAESSAARCCLGMQQKAADMCRQIEDYARKEPLTALLIAGGLGLIVGIALSRR